MKSDIRRSESTLCTVAPLAGAWIEIPDAAAKSIIPAVAPLAGAWIEICNVFSNAVRFSVAPLAGAWIEIDRLTKFISFEKSLPSRERGLK